MSAKPPTHQQQAMRRAFAARKIPNPPAKNRAARVHAWAEFVKQAIHDEDVSAKERDKNAHKPA